MGTKQTISANATNRDGTKVTNSDRKSDSPPLAGAQGNHKGHVRSNQAEANAMTEQKSLFFAYFLWLFGGIFGLHHLYLHRDRHAFVWWSTLGGYMGIGWLGEMFLIPEYVRDFNEDPRFVSEFVARLRAHQKPPHSSKRFLGQVLIGYLFGQVASMAIPQIPLFGIDFSFLHWSIAVAVAVGVWNVGNIGREQGVFWHCLVAALLAYPSRYLVYDETYTLLITSLVSAIAFDTFSKQWRRTPPRRRGVGERALKLTGCILIYCSLWGSFVYFNGTISDEDGGEVPIHEAIQNFLASAWWTDLKQALHDTYNYAQHHGWYETWKEVFESMDVDGERNAYKVLGVSATASQHDITAAYRRLSKEHHPDKVKDEALRARAHQRFIEIQQAYNVLSKIKSNRRRKNKKYQADEPIIM